MPDTKESKNTDIKRKRTSERQSEKIDKTHYLNLNVQIQKINLNIVKKKENSITMQEINLSYGQTKNKKQRKKNNELNEISKTVSNKQMKE